jgi:DNA-binding response OmpR family regulator
MEDNPVGVVLLVEDNIDILYANMQALVHDGYTVLTATTLAGAREILKTTAPDVVVLDIMLPDGDGLSFLPELRSVCNAPVLYLTAKDKPEERLAGLLAGGNDYITKPYDIAEFRVRVKNFISLLRDAHSATTNLTLGSVTLDMVARQAFINDENMGLAPKEFALLHIFVTNIDKVLSTEYLYEKAWGQAMFGDDYPVKKTVSRLRTKLDESEFIISTHRGVGYCFYRE